MPDMEKVTKGLGCCLSTDLNDCTPMRCPYFEFCGGHGAPDEILRDALTLLKAREQEIEDLKQEIEGHKDNLRETLDEMMRYADELKAQEPRLVTESDFKNADPYGYLPVWVEEKDDNEIICDCITKYAITEPDEDYHYRYWTSRPTDAQREATPWESVK